MFIEALQETPPAHTFNAEPIRCAWVVMSGAHESRAIADALTLSGWRIGGMVSNLTGLNRLLAQGGEPPELVVSGLRFDDGDGFQMIRNLARRPRPPAIYIASRQQRAVIRSAVVLAELCGLPVAGQAEWPMEPAQLAAALLHYRRPLARRAHHAPTPELKRDDLLSMFDRGALHPWLQPKIRLSSREIVGFEALMRAHDEQGKLVMPDRLVAALARYDMLDEATMRMAKQTVEFVANCLADGMAISASINVSMQSLSNLSFCQELAAAVEQVELDPSWITIEITETDAMADLAAVIENTARIRMLGFNLAIDDFGTSYSSLFQLSRIPFSELKIERAFVTGIEADSGKQAIVRACAQLGHSLGLHVVAEGVETLSELDYVQRAGCSQVQGYLVARPMPAEQALTWLSALDDQRFDWPTPSGV